MEKKKKIKKTIKLVEVARSFSRKINLGHYETADFFCSAKEEVLKKDVVKISEALFEFCKDETMKSVYAYKLENIPIEQPKKVTRQDYIKESKEAPAKEAEANITKDILEEEKFKEEKAEEEYKNLQPIESPKDEPKGYPE